MTTELNKPPEDTPPSGNRGTGSNQTRLAGGDGRIHIQQHNNVRPDGSRLLGQSPNQPPPFAAGPALIGERRKYGTV